MFLVKSRLADIYYVAPEKEDLIHYRIGTKKEAIKFKSRIFAECAIKGTSHPSDWQIVEVSDYAIYLGETELTAFSTVSYAEAHNKFTEFLSKIQLRKIN